MRSRSPWTPLAVCFAAGLAASVAWSCADECKCPDDELTPTKVNVAHVLAESGALPAGLPDFVAGTVEVTNTQVIVEYSRGEANYTVTYDIGAPAPNF